MDYKHHIKNLITKRKEDVLHTNKNKSSCAMLELMEEDFLNFDYSKDNDIDYIYDCFDILIEFLKGNENLQRLLSDKFANVHNLIRNLLHSKPENGSIIEKENYEKLKKIIDKMEDSMLIAYYNNPTEYDPNKEQFISYIIFKIKYINIVSNACEKFPHIVNSVDKDGLPLIEKVIDRYLKALDLYLSKENLGPIDDLIYYDKVINIIMTSEKIKIDDYTKTKLLNMVKEYVSSKKFTSNRLKEKLSFFTNSIINTISGIPNDLTIDYLSYKYEIHNKFKEAHNLEAKTIYIQHKSLECPECKRRIFTFDGEGAKEIDDGLSLTYEDGIYHLGVHIADPTYYIKGDSILFDEAKRRTTSRYIGDYCIPLFPFILSADLMSLNEGKPRYSMSYYYDIDARTGELINFNVKNEPIIVEKNLTYDYFNESLDNGCEDQEFFETLVNLSNLAEILKRVYSEEEIYGEFHNDKNSSLSQSVVESAMIYTNHNIAKYMSNHDLPFIYRCHSVNDHDKLVLTRLQERLRKNEGNTQMIKDLEMIKNLYPRAYYTSKNIGHYGLGTDFYSHSTSPLRRLADNLTNYCIKKFMLGNYTKEDKLMYLELIDEIAETINSKRASGEDYDKEYAKLKLID